MINVRSRHKRTRSYQFEVLCKRELLAADLVSGMIDSSHAASELAGDLDMHDLPKEPQAWVNHSRSQYAKALKADVAAAAPALSNTFRLHSRPTATKTIYIDFDGQTTRQTRWNSEENNGQVITSPPYDPAHNGPAFSNSELQSIQRIWQRVAADYAAFDVDVTTEDPGELALVNTGGGDTRWGARVIVTPVDFSNSGAGGFAYLNSFNRNYNIPGGTDTPCFVFNESEIGVSAAVSHEIGHTLGLTHDGTNANNTVSPNEEYYDGHGSGENGWGPIMGTGYYQNVTTWDQGEYLGANNTGAGANNNGGASDLAVITVANGFGFRPDDFGGDMATAANVDLTSFSAPGVLSVSKFGNIEGRTDLDFFKFQAGTGVANFTIDPYVSEFWVSNNNYGFDRSVDSAFFNGSNFTLNQGTNLDVEAKLYNAAGTLIATSNPAGLRARFDNVNLTAGIYYISVDGVGFGSPAATNPTGYTDYGSLGQYLVSGTFAAPALSLLPIAVDANKVEGNSGQTEFRFNVQLSQAQSSSVTVNWSVAGSGVQGADAADFGGTLPSGTFTFAPGVTSVPVSVFVSGDLTIESDETFTFTLSNPSVGQVLTNAVGVIQNDEHARMLFVDDDSGTTLDSYYKDAMNANGYVYQTWTVAQAGLPDSSELKKYEIVVWETGVATSGAGAGLTANEQTILADYMNSGGRVFLSGQNILMNNAVSLSFRQNYLRFDDYTSDLQSSPHTLNGFAGNLISDGMTLSLNPAPGTFIRTDSINPANGGVGVFQTPAGGSGPAAFTAVSYRGNTDHDYGIVFFAFSFEAIGSSAAAPNNQSTVMKRVIEYLSIDGYPKVEADQTAIVASEGALLTNSGTWSSSHFPDKPVTLTASFGNLVKNNDGTWSWSYQSTNELPNTLVTITAKDDLGRLATTTFNIVVNNVAPVLTVSQSSVTGQAYDEFVNEGTWFDAADSDSVTLGASQGEIVKNSDGTWKWRMRPTRASNNQEITISANDGTEITRITFKITVLAAATKGSVYYKGSPYVDNGDITPAIDTSKRMAKEGATAQTLTYANLINTKQGINGLVFEIPGGLDTTTLTAAAFDIRMSPQGLYNVAANQPASWQLAPSPSAIIVMSGTPDTPRSVRLEWPDNAIENRWLRVQILANVATGLSTPATFYIGHLRGELDGLTPASSYLVTNGDYAKMQPIGGGVVGVSESRDLDKNRLVINADLLLARAAVTAGLKLRNITIPAASAAAPEPTKVAQKNVVSSPSPLLATPLIQVATDRLLQKDVVVGSTSSTNAKPAAQTVPQLSLKSLALALANAVAANQKSTNAKAASDKFFASLGASDHGSPLV